MKIKIIGNGVWGNALASILKKNSYNINFWDRKETNINENVIIFSVPTQSIRNVLEKVKFNNENLIIINTSKGIEKLTHKLPFQIINEFLGKNVNYFSLMGPSFAEEVKQKMPTLVNLGYVNNAYTSKIKKIIQTDYFRVREIKGVEVLELAGAFKNVYAIACGVAEGLGFGINTRTKLIIIGMEEFYKLNKKLRNKVHLKMSPGTIGDLILTCSSTKSRNFKFGKLLVKHNAKDSLEKCVTVEGFYTVSSIDYFAKKNNVKLPLAQLVKDIIDADNPKDTRRKFLDFIKKV